MWIHLLDIYKRPNGLATTVAMQEFVFAYRKNGKHIEAERLEISVWKSGLVTGKRP